MLFHNFLRKKKFLFEDKFMKFVRRKRITFAKSMLTQFSIKYSEKSFDILGFLFLMDFIGKYYIRKK